MTPPLSALDPATEYSSLRTRARDVAVKTLEHFDLKAEDDLESAARSCIQVLAKEGFLRYVAPKDQGGELPAVSARAIVAAREGIAYGSGLADAMLALQALGSLPITLAGTDKQKKDLLPQVVTGKTITAFAVTEPAAGSDVASMTTRATPTKDGWQLDGSKTFISNAGLADRYTVFAKTDPEQGRKGISCFLVPADAKGLRAKPIKLMASHPVGTLQFEKVRLGSDAIVGKPGEGFRLALATLDIMRPTVAAAACGFAERALDEAMARGLSRRQFGQPILDNQGLRWKIAEAATDLEAARLLVERAARLTDAGQSRVTLESAQAKLFATEAAQRIVDLALQIHGGSGVVHGSIVERLYREVRALRIYEGTSEILRDVIGRALVERARPAPERA